MNILEISQIIFNITVSFAIILVCAFMIVIGVTIFRSVKSFEHFMRESKKEWAAVSFYVQRTVAGITAWPLIASFFKKKTKKKR